MKRELLFLSVLLGPLNTVLLADTYLQGVGTDHALSYSHDRFYSGSDKAFIGQAYDWSGVGQNSASQWATMISPSYFISAYHYHPGPGDTLTFYSGNSTSGPSYNFTVASGMLVPGSSDLYLGKLSTPIPAADNIATYPLWVLPSNSAYVGKDVFIYGVPNRVGRNVISYVSPAQVYCGFSASGGDGADEAYVMSGDSGGPSFGYYNGQLAVVGTHWHNSGSTPYDGALFDDTYVPGYITSIQANMVGETLGVTPLNGDANGDGTLDAGDIDALYKQYGTGEAGQAIVSAELKNVFRTGFGDANLDHKIGYLDFQAVLNHWSGPATWATGDFSGDGRVNFADFQIVLDNWSPVDTAQSSQVPEPAAISLLTLGALALLRRR